MSGSLNMHEADCAIMSEADYTILSQAADMHTETNCVLDDFLSLFHLIDGEYVALMSAIDALEIMDDTDADVIYSLSLEYKSMNFSSQTWNKFFG